MSKELIKALNRVARAMERSNDEKLQRKIARAKADEILKTLEDKATVARVTAALEGITHPERAALPPPNPIISRTVFPPGWPLQPPELGQPLNPTYGTGDVIPDPNKVLSEMP